MHQPTHYGCVVFVAEPPTPLPTPAPTEPTPLPTPEPGEDPTPVPTPYPTYEPRDQPPQPTAKEREGRREKKGAEDTLEGRGHFLPW